MAFSDNKAAVDINKRKDHALKHVGRDGEMRTYHPAKSMWLRLQELQVAQQLAEPAGGETQPTLFTYLHGVARLDESGLLSVIDDSEDATHIVHVSFTAREVSVADRQGLGKLQDELGISLSDVALGSARLGVNRSNRQTGEPNQWWLTCHVPAICLDALSKAVAESQLSAVELGLSLRNLYTADDVIAHVARQSHFFLRPNKSDNTADWPEFASGYITNLTIDLASVDLRGANDMVTGDENTRCDEAAKNTVANTISTLANKVENMGIAIKWVGVLIAVHLVAAALKNL
jgi:phosphate:Na+ symporter